MSTDFDTTARHPACVACWEALISSARTGEAPNASTAEHLETCPSCREASGGIERLGLALSGLAGRIERESKDRSLSPSSPEAMMLFVRLARYETWHRRARRLCAASVGIAASLALLFVVLFGVSTGATADGPGGRTQAVAVDGRLGAETQDLPLDSAVASTIPVHGWVDLPPQGTSADSSVWWVVLNYGGHR